MKRQLLFLCLLLIVVWSLPASAATASKKTMYRPGKVVVKFKDTVAGNAEAMVGGKNKFATASKGKGVSLDALMVKHGVKAARPVFRKAKTESVSIEQLKKEEAARMTKGPSRLVHQLPTAEQVPDLYNVYVLDLDPKASVEEAVKDFKADPNVIYAEPEMIFTVNQIPNDPYYSSRGSWGQNYDDLWGLKNIDAEIAWDFSSGQGVVVAVVDSGVDYNHPDIARNIWDNTDEIAANGVDDDHNGFIDDVHGFDFTRCTRVTGGWFLPLVCEEKEPDNDPMDDKGHGTHVAGTIAALGNNGIGIIGVAPGAKIMPVKALDANGSGFSDELAAAVRYAADNGADVMNLSWGGEGHNNVIHDAVKYAYARGVVIVAAAGNSNDDTSGYSPTRFQEVLSVSALNPYDLKTVFSSFGYKIDVGAPGGGSDASQEVYNILSLSSQAGPCDQNLRVGDDYCRLAGTSMAAPHVSGLAALILSRYPKLTVEQVRSTIRNTADDMGVPGFDIESGFGRIDAAAAVQRPSSAEVRFDFAGPSYDLYQRPLEIKSTPTGIFGTAKANNLSFYEVSYRPLNLPVEEWQSLGKRYVAAEHGELGVLDTNNLVSGDPYVLRLQLTDTSGQRWEEYLGFRPRYPHGQVIDSAGDQAATGVDAGRVVYHRKTNGQYDVYLYNIATGQTINLSNHPADQTDPVIEGDNVLWRDSRHGEYGGEVYHHNLSTNVTRRVTVNSDLEDGFRLSGGRALWHYQGNYYDDPEGFMVYDMAAGTLAGNPSGYGRIDAADLYKDFVIFRAYNLSERTTSFYLHNVVTSQTENLFSTRKAMASFQLFGQLLVWEEYDPSEPRNRDIVLYNLATKAVKQLTDEKISEVTAPNIGRASVVWAGEGYGNNTFVKYDLASGKTQALMDRLTCEVCTTENRISSSADYFIWNDGDKDVEEPKVSLFWMRLPAGTNAAPRFEGVVDQTTYTNYEMALPVAAVDPEGVVQSMYATLSDGTSLAGIGAVFTDRGLGRGLLTWKPSAAQGNKEYVIKLTVVDDRGLTGTQLLKIKVLLSQASLTSPLAGSVLPGSTVTFTRDNGFGASAYELLIGTGGPGTSNIYKAAMPSSVSVSGIPVTGVKIYARLNSTVNGVVLARDYVFQSKDLTAPTGSVLINNNASSTSSVSVTLKLSASDAGSGMGAGSQMQFSNDNVTWSAAQAYATYKTWTLSAGAGTKTVYVKFKDAAGNWSSVYSDSITYQPPALQTVTFKPCSAAICGGYSSNTASMNMVSGSVSTYASGEVRVVISSLRDNATGAIAANRQLDVYLGRFSSYGFSGGYIGWIKTDAYGNYNGNIQSSSGAYSVVAGSVPSSDFILNTPGVRSEFTTGMAVANQAPSVSLTSPVSGSQYTAPGTITLTANASDPDGSITKVEFYNGSTLIATRTSAPYSYTWAGVAAGSYTLTARATDNAGAVTTSAAVSVSVSAYSPGKVAYFQPCNASICGGYSQNTSTLSFTEAKAMVLNTGEVRIKITGLKYIASGLTAANQTYHVYRGTFSGYPSYVGTITTNTYGSYDGNIMNGTSVYSVPAGSTVDGFVINTPGVRSEMVTGAFTAM